VQPTVLQVVAWLLYAVPVSTLFVLRTRRALPARRTPAAQGAGA
jgi:hypothetical protein